MIDEEVSSVLREIRERVAAEHAAIEQAAPTDLQASAGDADFSAILDENSQVTDSTLDVMHARLTVTERAWDRLPPIVSNRHGALAKIELWAKRHAKSAARWFTWEQINFNAAVHNALNDAWQALSRQARALAAQRAQVQSEFEQSRAETDDLREEVMAELRAESAARRRASEKSQEDLKKQRTETEIVRSEMLAQSEALQTEMESRRLEIETLRSEMLAESERLRSEIESRRAATETLRAEAFAESEGLRAEIESRRADTETFRAEAVAESKELRAEIESWRAEAETLRNQHPETDQLRSELHAESEALRIEIEKRRIEINNLRAQLRTPSSDEAKSKELFAKPRVVHSLNDCFFYHSMDLPGHGTVEGHWDLRGHESQYLGEVAFKGQRVLEIGPASGHLSFFMERNGAEVVSVDADDDYEWEFTWDISDEASDELQTQLAAHREMMRRLKNSYWFAHKALNSAARVHYGSAYAVPKDLGRFDLSVIASVLLHNKSPLKILENCARLTNDTMIVVEAFRETQLTQSPAEFLPKASESLWHTWWAFSPIYFVDILRSMGFPDSRVTFHQQMWQGKPTSLFTVVAKRSQSSAIIENEVPTNLEISSVVEQLNLRAGALTKIPVSILNRDEIPLSPAVPKPLLLSYHWLSESGAIIEWDGLRTPLPRPLYSGDHENLMLSVRAPAEPGSYLLEISLVEEYVKWADEEAPNLPVRIKVTVK
jgi:2-polyprenyl-3-methyl-5-hydroxy-6-metoxy-1,4-benzoquinol methylase